MLGCAAIMLGACTSGSDPSAGSTTTGRRLTTEESEALAISRFANYDAGLRQVDATIPDGTHTWRLRGWFDYRDRRGYATLWADGSEMAAALLMWSDQYLFSSQSGDVAAGDLPPLPVPETDEATAAWVPTDYAPEKHVPHAALQIIASLGADRPENPLLLQQSDARWLRTEEIDGVDLRVVSGPRPAQSADRARPGERADDAANDATVRYWIDRDGAMYRVEMRLGNAWGSVDLSAPGTTKVMIPDLTR
ncbi:hypothetical protein [Phytoactinopolyspora halotolerans]|uniref:hypothetical protein n=1 Tax=Phytoactinopolyspora halotolerans TaxID=1981512 RepID=UPI0013D21EBC|nr:hypothetical protein [Phytoactinopolyspora halotolerans]